MEPDTYAWSDAKNQWLLKERSVSFEMAIAAIESGGLLDILENKKPREHQQIYVMRIDEEIYAVPVVKTEDGIFMKTMYPSRKLRKLYGTEEN